MYRIHISNGAKGPYTEESFQIQNINNTLKILLLCTVHLGKKEKKKKVYFFDGTSCFD